METYQELIEIQHNRRCRIPGVYLESSLIICASTVGVGEAGYEIHRRHARHSNADVEGDVELAGGRQNIDADQAKGIHAGLCRQVHPQIQGIHRGHDHDAHIQIRDVETDGVGVQLVGAD